MNAEKLTQKSQEALHDAQTKALRFGHTEVDGEHLLLALLDQAEGLCHACSAVGADPDRIHQSSRRRFHSAPVSGPGAAPGQVFLTQRLSRLLDRADRRRRGSRTIVSVEHLVIALLDEGAATAAGRLLHDRG